jgi:hypothetical protein
MDYKISSQKLDDEDFLLKWQQDLEMIDISSANLTQLTEIIKKGLNQRV